MLVVENGKILKSEPFRNCDEKRIRLIVDNHGKLAPSNKNQKNKWEGQVC